MFDLFWDFDRLSKAERKSKQRSRDLNPFLGIFGFWAYVTGMGMSDPWVYPCLGPFCNV
jgi:hypothetical protein